MDKSDSLPGSPQVSRAPQAPRSPAPRPAPHRDPDPFVRAANEDDDGYDPYSDRPAAREPLWEPDPWR